MMLGRGALAARCALAAVVTAPYNIAIDVPVTASSYTATRNAVK